MTKDDTRPAGFDNKKKVRSCIDDFWDSRRDVMLRLIHVNDNEFSITDLCKLMDVDFNLFCSMVNGLSGSDVIGPDDKTIVRGKDSESDVFLLGEYPVEIDLNRKTLSIKEDLFSQPQKDLIRHLFCQAVAFHVRDNGKNSNRVSIRETCERFSISEDEAKSTVEYVQERISNLIKTDDEGSGGFRFEDDPTSYETLEALDRQELMSVLGVTSMTAEEWDRQVERLIHLGYVREATNKLYRADDHDLAYSPKLTLGLLSHLKYCPGQKGTKDVIAAVNPRLKDEARAAVTRDRIIRVLVSYQNAITRCILSLFRLKESNSLSLQAVRESLQVSDDQIENSLWTLRSRGMDAVHEKDGDRIVISDYGKDYEKRMRLKRMIEWFIGGNKATNYASEGIAREEIEDFFQIGYTGLTKAMKEWKDAGFDFTNRNGFVSMSLKPGEDFHGDAGVLSNVLLNVVDQGFIDADCANALLLLLAIGARQDRDKNVFDFEDANASKIEAVFDTIERFHRDNAFTEIKTKILKEKKKKSLEECSDEIKNRIYDEQKGLALQLLRKYAVPMKGGMKKVDGYVAKKSGTKFVNDFFLKLDHMLDSMEKYSSVIAEGSFHSKLLLGVVNQTRRVNKSSLTCIGGEPGDLAALASCIEILNRNDYKNNYLSFKYLTNEGREKPYNAFRACFVGYSQSSGRAYLLGYHKAGEIVALRTSNVYWETMAPAAPSKKDAEAAGPEAGKAGKRVEDTERLRHEMFDFDPAKKLIPVKVEFNVRDHGEIVDELRAHENSRRQTCSLEYRYENGDCTKEYDGNRTVEIITYTDAVRGQGDLSRFLRRYADVIKIVENDDLKNLFRITANHVIENYRQDPKPENPAPVFENPSAHLEMTYGTRFKNAAAVSFAEEDQHLPHDVTYAVEGTTAEGLDVAAVDRKGNVTALRAGDVVVKAICRGNARFSSSRSEYRLTIHKAKQEMSIRNEVNPLVFVNETFAIRVEGAKTAVTYRVAADSRETAAVSEGGIVTALRPGKAIILVTATENDKYLEHTLSYPFEILEMPDCKTENGILSFQAGASVTINLFEDPKGYGFPASMTKADARVCRDAVISYHVIKEKPSGLTPARVNNAGFVVPLNAGSFTIMAACVRNHELVSHARLHVLVKGIAQKLRVPQKPITLYQGDACAKALKGMRTTPAYVSEDTGVVDVSDDGSTLVAKGTGTVKIHVRATANEKYQEAGADFYVEVKDRGEKMESLLSQDAEPEPEAFASKVDKTVQYAPICRMARLMHALISLAEEDKTTMRDLAKKLMLPLKIVKKDVYDVCTTEPAASLIKIRFQNPDSAEWQPLGKKISEKDFLKDPKYDDIKLRSEYKPDPHAESEDNYLVLSDAESAALQKAVTNPDDYVYKGISYVKTPMNMISEDSSTYSEVSKLLGSERSCMVEHPDLMQNQKVGVLPVTSFFSTENGRRYVACINEVPGNDEKLEISFLDARHFKVVRKMPCKSLDEKITALGRSLLSDAELKELGFNALPSGEAQTSQQRAKIIQLNNAALDKAMDLSRQLFNCVWVPESIPLDAASFREVEIGIKKEQSNVLEKIKKEVTRALNTGNATITDGADGWDILKIKVSGGMAEFKRWILSYGGSIKVISPAALGEEICKTYEDLLNPKNNRL